MQHLDQRLFFQLPQVDLSSIRVNSREVARVHGQEGQLQVEMLGFGDDGEVAVRIVGKVLCYSGVFLSVYLNHIHYKQAGLILVSQRRGVLLFN